MPDAHPSRPAARKDARPKGAHTVPWYAGKYKDALFYLLIAVFFLKLVVGRVDYFYGIMYAAPEAAGGAPVSCFRWPAWCLAAVLALVGLLLVVHLAGTRLSRTLTREDTQAEMGTRGQETPGAGPDNLPEDLRLFYAMVRNAPTLVVLLGILLLGAGLFFAGGALSALGRAGALLIPISRGLPAALPPCSPCASSGMPGSSTANGAWSRNTPIATMCWRARAWRSWTSPAWRCPRATAWAPQARSSASRCAGSPAKSGGHAGATQTPQAGEPK